VKTYLLFQEVNSWSLLVW